MTIDPLALDLGGTMKQVLAVPDASGLTPLELPAGLARQEGDNARPSPSQDAVSRFQAAMGETRTSSFLGLVNRPAAVCSPEGLERPKRPEGLGTPAAPTNVAFPVSDTPEGTGNREQGTGSGILPVSDTTEVTGNGERGTGNGSLPVSDTIEVTGNGKRGTGNGSLPVSDTIEVTGNGERETVINRPTVQPSNRQTAGVTGNGEWGTVQRFNGSTVQRTAQPSNHPTVQPSNRQTAGETVQRTAQPSNRPTVKPLPETDEPEPLQAAPVVVPREALPADTTPVAAAGAVSLIIDPASATARTQELVDAAAAVADTILVTPSLVHGEGEVTIRLKPTVLDGSEIRLEAKGEAITVALTPATVEVQRLAEQSQARFAAELTERIPSFQIAVVINPRLTTSRRNLDNETA